MSRVGNAPIKVPSGVKVNINAGKCAVEGPKGKLEREFRPEIEVALNDFEGAQVIQLKRKVDDKESRAFHGMERALINNMVTGVSDGFEKILEVNGVGYKAEVKGKIINLGLGFSHDINFPIPEGVKASILKEGRDIAIKLEGVDRQLIGQVAAQIRSLRPPEPYKGKGVKYRGEQIRRKAGKAGKK